MSISAAADVRPHFIPSAGHRFRLVSKHTNQVLYAYQDAKVDGVPKSGVTDAEPVNNNQFWRLIPAGDGFSGQYLIVSDVYNGVAMYADRNKNHWYLSNKLSSHGSFFAFRQVSAGEGWFRIYNPNYKIKCIMSAQIDQALLTVGADSEDYGDQVFGFEVEDLEIVRPIQYDLSSAYIVSQQKVELASETINNYGDILLSQNLCCSRMKSYFQSFLPASGTFIGVDTTFEVGVPFVRNGKIGVAVSSTQTWHWGKTVTNAPTIEWNIPISTPPRRKYRFTRYITEGQLSVPYTITLRSRKFGHTVTNSGVAIAVATWDSYTNVQDMGPAISDDNNIEDNIEGGADNRTGGGQGED